MVECPAVKSIDGGGASGAPAQRTYEELAEEVEQLRTALESNRTIAMAIGIMMERHHVDQQHARAYLIRLSQTGNTKLFAIAEKIVADRNRRA
jgi:AmiR/NasT family two-component response regulator